ncbi:MAG: GDP-mannose 4,6-dehydratase [Actinomycetota bacterium]|nr:GDP-mannose 4,6-dehydratase [Actinomycetota bacterium]
MRALVTGAGGFVGKWLVEHLRDQGDEVVAVDRDVDVTDTSAVRTAVLDALPAAVYHLAALSHVGQSWDDPSAVVHVNTVGTSTVLDACARCPDLPTVLVVSSAEVYGRVASSRQPISEDEPLAPVTPYAGSKAAAEMLAVQAHLGRGLPVVRVRPFNHVGPGQSEAFVVPALATRIVAAQRNGAPTIAVGNLSARRDLTDVRDVVRAYRLAVVHGIPGAVYNVCSGTSPSIDEVARSLLRLAGAELDLEVDPTLARPADVPVVRGDPGRLHAATGWVPRYALEQTLTDVLDDCRRVV